MQQWRLIPMIHGSGALQMAIDRWLFDQCALHGHPPTLRFYTWSPAAISLGRLQKRWPDHWHSLEWQGQPIDIVRRPTGGRAVLHAGDLTYSVVLPQQSGHCRETYEYICGFLIEGWRSLGINLHYGSTGRGYIGQANCFQTATQADLVTDLGIKLIGSAQAWQHTTVLQHGSLQIHRDPYLWTTVFETELSSLDISMPSVEAIVETLIQSATQYLKGQFELSEFTNAEWRSIQSLTQQQLAHKEIESPIHHKG